MYTAIALVSLGSASLWSAAVACQYTEHSSAVLAGNDALRVPLASTGAGAQNECAATAEAFGLSVASIGELLHYSLSEILLTATTPELPLSLSFYTSPRAKRSEQGVCMLICTSLYWYAKVSLRCHTNSQQRHRRRNCVSFCAPRPPGSVWTLQTSSLHVSGRLTRLNFKLYPIELAPS